MSSARATISWLADVRGPFDAKTGQYVIDPRVQVFGNGDLLDLIFGDMPYVYIFCVLPRVCRSFHSILAPRAATVIRRRLIERMAEKNVPHASAQRILDACAQYGAVITGSMLLQVLMSTPNRPRGVVWPDSGDLDIIPLRAFDRKESEEYTALRPAEGRVCPRFCREKSKPYCGDSTWAETAKHVPGESLWCPRCRIHSADGGIYYLQEEAMTKSGKLGETISTSSVPTPLEVELCDLFADSCHVKDKEYFPFGNKVGIVRARKRALTPTSDAVELGIPLFVDFITLDAFNQVYAQDCPAIDLVNYFGMDILANGLKLEPTSSKLRVCAPYGIMTKTSACASARASEALKEKYKSRGFRIVDMTCLSFTPEQDKFIVARHDFFANRLGRKLGRKIRPVEAARDSLFKKAVQSNNYTISLPLAPAQAAAKRPSSSSTKKAPPAKRERPAPAQPVPKAVEEEPEDIPKDLYSTWDEK